MAERYEYVTNPEKTRYWKVPRRLRGMTVGTDLSLEALAQAGGVEVAFEEYDKWNHASCQSGCIRRGDPKCVW